MSAIDDIVSRLIALPESERNAVITSAMRATEGMRWVPSPGPQTMAYFSEADILLYGGEPGGGKTALLLGLAFTAHRRSLIMRRQYTDLGAILDEAIKINGGRQGYNGSPPPSLRIPDEDRFIEFGAAARPGDEQHWQGNPHDLLGFDEGAQFGEQQIRFLMGWLRSTVPGQRKRAVIATNPPLSAEGLWLTRMFSPWIDPTHPLPAKPGELRWFVTDADGKDVEVNGPEPVDMDGKSITPLSRTFIPASVKDNPYLSGTDYEKQLHNMVEPYRSLLMGGFRTTFRDQENQVIPLSWVQTAQERWSPNPPYGTPMCALGVDVAAGGEDETVLAPRFDGWYAPLITLPGRETPLPRDVAGAVISHRRDRAIVVLDMGGGYGGGVFEHLRNNEIDVLPWKGAEGSVRRTTDRQLKFTNKRSEAWWKFREALDPGQANGSPIMLPPDPVLVSDLCAPTFEVTAQGLKVEPKQDVCERLGRSTDRGDAVVMAWQGGPTYLTDGRLWEQQRKETRPLGRRPVVIKGRQQAALMGRRS